MMAAPESFEAEKFSLGEKASPIKIKKKVCRKMLIRPFPMFLAYVFLSGKSADPHPPLLVENSTFF